MAVVLLVEDEDQVRVLAESFLQTAFHTNLGISIKSGSIRKEDAWYTAYHFADRDHAKLFQLMFGGKPIDHHSSR